MGEGNCMTCLFFLNKIFYKKTGHFRIGGLLLVRQSEARVNDQSMSLQPTEFFIRQVVDAPPPLFMLPAVCTAVQRAPSRRRGGGGIATQNAHREHRQHRFVDV